MAELYKKCFRGYLIDHHAPAPPVVTYENISKEEHRQFYRTAGINSLMLYCKDHWGYSYYDTAVGTKHPGIKTDWVGEISGVLKEEDIEFNAYYCIEYDTISVEQHPEWAVLKQDGSRLKCEGRNAKWGIPCYLRGYRQYALNQLKEIVTAYTPDSLFLDIFGKSLCYCPECLAEFRKKTGTPLPESKEEIVKRTPEILDFLDDLAEDFLDEVLASVKNIDPELAVTINFSSHYPKRIRDKLDYHFTEPWAGNRLSAAYARATGRYPQLGPGDVSKIFDYHNESVYVQAAADITAQGCRVFLYSEPQLPDGSLEEREAELVGAAMEEVGKYEELLSGREIIAEIGIVQSDDSVNLGYADLFPANAIPRAKAVNRHKQAVLGAMQICDQLKLPWTIIPIDDLSAGIPASIKILILPEVFVLPGETVRIIENFVKQGGTAAATGGTGLYERNGEQRPGFSFSGFTGINFTGIREKYKPNVWGGYISFCDGPFSERLNRTTPPISETSYEIAGDFRTWGQFTAPATVLTETSWVNWGYPPPKDETREPLIVSSESGSGSFWYAGFDLFGVAAQGMEWPAAFLKTLLEQQQYTPEITLETEIPHLINIASYYRRNQIIVHIISDTSRIASGDTPELNPGVLKARVSLGIKRASLFYPEKSELAVKRHDNDIIEVVLPQVKIHQIIVLEAENETK
ncbi:MAG: alpha-L-fucosidase [Spirochaetia bacterium]